MNVLIVNSFYFPNMPGGAEHSVKLLAENLVKNGVYVRVYTLDGENPNQITRETINGVEVFRGHDPFFSLQKHYNARNNFEKILCRTRNLRNTRIKKDLACIMENNYKPDVVHVNSIYGISWYVFKYFHDKDIKVIYTIRDYFLMDPKARINGSNKIVTFIYQNYYRRKTSKYVDAVTAPSVFTLDAFVRIGYFSNAEQRCIVNSICFDREEVKRIVNHKTQNKDSAVRFLFVGALTHEKGIDNLLSAFKDTASNDITLSICGSGKLKDKVILETKEDTRIHYHGQLNSEAIKQVYMDSDVLVAPSTWDEPFGRIIIEANQYGLAVIGSNRAGIGETLDYMKSGEKIDPDSLLSITEAIDRFSDKQYYQRYVQNIPERLQRYSIEYQINSFIKLYMQQINEVKR